MRCAVCGRPPQADVTAGKEALNPREIVDQGCIEEFRGFIAEVDEKGARKYSNEVAMQMARRCHEAREISAWNAKVKSRLTNIAAGKHGDTGVALVGTAQQIADAKAVAAAQLAAMSAVPVSAKQLADDWAEAVSK